MSHELLALTSSYFLVSHLPRKCIQPLLFVLCQTYPSQQCHRCCQGRKEYDEPSCAWWTHHFWHCSSAFLQDWRWQDEGYPGLGACQKWSFLIITPTVALTSFMEAVNKKSFHLVVNLDKVKAADDLHRKLNEYCTTTLEEHGS
jgi:hypothetical protein